VYMDVCVCVCVYVFYVCVCVCVCVLCMYDMDFVFADIYTSVNNARVCDGVACVMVSCVCVCMCVCMCMCVYACVCVCVCVYVYIQVRNTASLIFSGLIKSLDEDSPVLMKYLVCVHHCVGK